MLGKDIVSILIKEVNYEVYGIDRNYNSTLTKDKQFNIDLTNHNLLNQILLRIEPDIIVHCAAIVNLDLCQNNKELAYNLHFKTTRLLSAFNSLETKFIYISTDSVFDGIKGNYSEEEIPNPLNYYAKSKYMGELISLKNNKNTVVIRTNIYGFKNPEGHSLAEWALENFKNNKQIDGFKDVIFNPLYTKQLARLIYKLIQDNKFTGILNASSAEYISKFEFLNRIAMIWGFNKELVKEINMTDLAFSVLRPKNTTLKTQKLSLLFNEIPQFNEGLNEFFKDYMEFLIERNDLNV